MAIKSALLVNLAAAPILSVFISTGTWRREVVDLLPLSFSTQDSTFTACAAISYTPRSYSSHWLLPCHMGYYAAFCPGALFLVPLLANCGLNPYLWMRDLVCDDPSSISSSVIATQVCLWSRSFIFLQ